jgi:hypothetical protein
MKAGAAMPKPMKNQRCQPEARQEGEGRARVVHPHEVEEARHRAHLAELEPADDEGLGELVQQDDGTATPSHRLGAAPRRGARPSGHHAGLAGAVQVARAAAAQRGVRRVVARVLAPVPAAFALAWRAGGRHRHGQAPAPGRA